MRSYFYDLEEEERSGYRLYRIGSRNDENSKLHFVIISNWLMNEAYIMAESDLIDLTDLKSNIQLINEKDTLLLSGKDAEANYRFAANLYDILNRGGKLSFLDENRSMVFSESEKKSLERSLKDYFKLVGKLR